MFKPPPDNEWSKPKKVGAKTYYWCNAAKVWGTHTANECRAGKDKHQGKTTENKKKLRFSKALQAVAEDNNSSARSDE